MKLKPEEVVLIADMARECGEDVDAYCSGSSRWRHLRDGRIVRVRVSVMKEEDLPSPHPDSEGE